MPIRNLESISDGADWIKDVMGPLSSPDKNMRPCILPTVIVPGIDVFGSKAYEAGLTSHAVAGSASAVAVTGTSPAAGKLWFITAAQATHDDAVARFLTLNVYDIAAGGRAIAVVRTEVAAAAEFQLALNRPMVITENFAMHAAVDAITAGKRITIAWSYIILDAGQYVWSP